MTLYKIGKVVSQKEKYIIFESNYIGETIYISKSNTFELNKIIKLFIYQYNNEYTHDTYGFKTFNERYLFIDLISLAGVGPKTAILILNYDYLKVGEWIAKGEIDKLNQIPNIGTKLARQLVFELQEKYSYFYSQQNKAGKVSKISSNQNEKNTKLIDLKATLKTLGFQKGQIDIAINNINNLSLPIEQLIEESISLISNAK